MILNVKVLHVTHSMKILLRNKELDSVLNLVSHSFIYDFIFYKIFQGYGFICITEYKNLYYSL